MTARNPCYALTNAGAHPADNFRRALGSAISIAGIDNPGDLLCTFVDSLHVAVAAGACVVPGTIQADEGLYACYNDASVTLPVVGNSANPRHDIVIAQVQDDQYTGGTHAWQLTVIEGTPAGSPTDPALPSNSLALARLVVPATSGNYTITDLRNTTINTTGYFGTAGPPNTTANSGQNSFITPHVGDTMVDVNLVSWRWNGSVWLPLNEGPANFRAYQHGAGSPSTSGALLPFDTMANDGASWDVLGGWGATTAHMYTIPTGWGGKWRVASQVTCGGIVAGNNWIAIVVNGSSNVNTSGRAISFLGANVSGAATVDVETTIKVSAGDTVGIMILFASGASFNVANGGTVGLTGASDCFIEGEFVSAS